MKSNLIHQMEPQIRLCLIAGAESKVEIKNGRFTIEGPASKSYANYVEFVFTFANVSQVFCASSGQECIDQLSLNQSDFALAAFSIHDTSGNFSVPVPAYPTTLNFFSGYNLFRYQAEQTLAQKKALGVLENFTSFSPIIYALINLWMLTLLLIVFFRVLLMQRRPAHVKALVRSLKSFVRMGTGRSKRGLLLSLNLNLGLFFLVTPFCLLFKTNQVILKEPKLIKTYEEIMNKRVQMVYTKLGISETEFFNLGSNTRKGKVMQMVHEYFNLNSRLITLDRSPETFDLIGELAKGIVENKLVILGSDAITEALRQIFCSWSSEPNLYQVLSFRDPHQEEMIVGYTFRVSNPPRRLVRMLLYAFEAHIPSTLSTLLNNYVGIEMLPNPEGHRHRQLLLCQMKHLAPYHKEQVAAADMAFFLPFIFINFALISLSLTLLALEKVIFSGTRRRRMRRRILRHYPIVKLKNPRTCLGWATI